MPSKRVRYPWLESPHDDWVASINADPTPVTHLMGCWSGPSLGHAHWLMHRIAPVAVGSDRCGSSSSPLRVLGSLQRAMGFVAYGTAGPRVIPDDVAAGVSVRGSSLSVLSLSRSRLRRAAG